MRGLANEQYNSAWDAGPWGESTQPTAKEELEAIPGYVPDDKLVKLPTDTSPGDDDPTGWD